MRLWVEGVKPGLSFMCTPLRPVLRVVQHSVCIHSTLLVSLGALSPAVIIAACLVVYRSANIAAADRMEERMCHVSPALIRRNERWGRYEG